jgi:putative flippase GtrA
LAYLIAVPVSFLGQKHFTFKSKESARRELPAYLLLQGLNLCAAMLITYVVVDVLSMGYVMGIFAVVVIAGLSYLAMGLAVFRRVPSHAGANREGNLP